MYVPLSIKYSMWNICYRTHHNDAYTASDIFFSCLFLPINIIKVKLFLLPAGRCNSNTCQNSGTCSETGTICRCCVGYTGQYCQNPPCKLGIMFKKNKTYKNIESIFSNLLFSILISNDIQINHIFSAYEK